VDGAADAIAAALARAGVLAREGVGG
jgi:hypothetical protein